MNKPPEQFTSEDEWTAKLSGMLSRRSDVVVGIGDDAAVVRLSGGHDRVYTTDAVIEGTHFLPGTEPGRIGHKMVGRLLSDLAAMGAEPEHILLNFVVPPDLTAVNMERVYAGADKLAGRFGASIVGGDTVRGSPLSLHGFAVGRVSEGHAVLRSGAQSGDKLFVTGELGGSLTGKHLDFEPRVAQGLWLRKSGWVTSMMDISDGLSRDMRRLCQASGVGARVTAGAIPFSESMGVSLSEEEKLRHALCDGEDYELLFTVKPEHTAALVQAWPTDFPRLTGIGTMEGSAGDVMLVLADHTTSPWPASGYDHISK